MSEESFLACALRYAALGWPVFPLGKNSKYPLFAKKYGGNGCKDATCDVGTITTWWTKYHDANIGIATGRGIMVLDVDPRNGGDETLDDLQTQYGVLPQTVVAITGSGGTHYFYSCPSGAELKATLGRGLDVKGAGGYVVGAPSVHPTTKRPYLWEASSDPWQANVGPAPAWILARLKRKPVIVRGDEHEAIGEASKSFLGLAFAAMGWLGSDICATKTCCTCPWTHLHSGAECQSSSILFAPTRSAPLGNFYCSHSHCQGRRIGDVLASLKPQAVNVACENYPGLISFANTIRRKALHHG